METENKMQNSLNKGKKNIICQKINKYKKNVRFDYDEKTIKDFRKKFPELVKNMEEKIIKETNYLKYKGYKKFLDKKVNEMIFPPVLERPDGYFFWQKDEQLDRGGKTLGGYHLPLNEEELEMLEAFTGGSIIMYEILESILEELTLEENTLVKMYYGVDPYEIHTNLKELYKNLTKEEKEKLGIYGVHSTEVEVIVQRRVHEVLKKVREILKNE